MEFQAGQTIGDYEILGVLGTGGMGQVLRVRNVISEREEAMKVMLPGFASGPEVLDRFLREIKVQASLVHPNIAALHTAMRSGDHILMIMELVEGETLRDKLRFGALPVAESLGYIDQVLSALAFAHSRGVVHRDVKPANILINPQGLAKLTDFGIARSAREHTITGTGLAVGSLSYMSPEQIRSAPADARSDIYSTGATLYEALTGRRPFEGENDYAILYGHLNRMATAPHEVDPGVPRAISSAVMKSLEKDPGQRFASALDFQAALRDFAASPTLRAVSGTASHGGALERLEAHLAKRMGPIARSIVRDAALRHASLDEVFKAAAAHLPEGPEREAFLRACNTDRALTPVPDEGTHPATPTPVAGGAALDPAALQTAREKLAAYLGPIAEVMVSRTARKAGSVDEFYEQLSALVPEGRERQAFLKAVGRA